MKSKHATLFNNPILAKAVAEGKAIRLAREQEKWEEERKKLPPPKMPIEYLKEAREREKKAGF